MGELIILTSILWQVSDDQSDRTEANSLASSCLCETTDDFPTSDNGSHNTLTADFEGRFPAAACGEESKDRPKSCESSKTLPDIHICCHDNNDDDDDKEEESIYEDIEPVKMKDENILETEQI